MEIQVELPKNTVSLAGTDKGKQFYNDIEKKVKSKGANEVRVVFPKQTRHINSSFLEGFYNEMELSLGSNFNQLAYKVRLILQGKDVTEISITNWRK